jgi:hypothetical protein
MASVCSRSGIGDDVRLLTRNRLAGDIPRVARGIGALPIDEVVLGGEAA